MAHTTSVVIRNLARRIQGLNTEMRSIDDGLVGLIRVVVRRDQQRGGGVDEWIERQIENASQ